MIGVLDEAQSEEFNRRGIARVPWVRLRADRAAVAAGVWEVLSQAVH